MACLCNRIHILIKNSETAIDDVVAPLACKRTLIFIFERRTKKNALLSCEYAMQPVVIQVIDVMKTFSSHDWHTPHIECFFVFPP